MLYILVVAIQAFIQVVMLGASNSPIVFKPPYTSYKYPCSCKSDWFHNSTPIYPRRGKYLISPTHLEILDLRTNDSGVYTCPSVSFSVYACGNFSLFVDDVNEDYASIHVNTVPYDASEELPDRVYWHPKMKRTNVVAYFDDKPLVLFSYFYSTANTTPNVTWSGPADSLLFPNQMARIRKLNCNSLEETQRPLNGTCYESSYTIWAMSGSSYFSCVVSTPNGSGIRARFTVLKNALHWFSDETLSAPQGSYHDELLEGSDWHDELPDPILIDIFRPGTTSPSTPTATSKSSINESLSTVHNGSEPLHPSSTTPTPSLLTHVPLQPANWSEFEFFPITSTVQRGGNITLVCRLPRLIYRLELWYLGRPSSNKQVSNEDRTCLPMGCYDHEPELLKVSELTPFHFDDGKGKITTKYELAPSVFVTIVQFDELHVGTYLCRYQRFYRILEVKLKSLAETGASLDFRPLALVLVLICLVVVSLLFSLLMCIRSLRKPTVTVLKTSDKGISSRTLARVTISGRTNVLYPNSPFEKSLKDNLVPFDDSPMSFLTTNDYQNTIEDTKMEERQRTVFRRRTLTNPRYLCHRIGNPDMTSKYLLPCDPSWEIPRSSIKAVQLIGEGSFGAVYRGIATLSPAGTTQTSNSKTSFSITVAIKTLKGNFDHEVLQNLMLELETMKSLKPHPHIIRLLGACTRRGPPMILMEFAKHGNLRDFLRQNRPVSDRLGVCGLSNLGSTYPLLAKLDSPVLLRFARHVANALTYLESLQLVHCDIAARNVLIMEDLVAKLCDFGFTRPVGDCDVEKNRERFPFRWMAPECFDGNRFTQKSDMWSFGIFLWELFTLGQIPYPGLSNAQLREWLESGNRNEQPALASSSVYDLMLRCWTIEPDLRPTFDEMFSLLQNLSTPYLSVDSGVSGSDSSSLNLSPSKDKPAPPLRTCSLRGHDDLSKGYVEMRFEDYLEPRVHECPFELPFSS